MTTKDTKEVKTNILKLFDHLIMLNEFRNKHEEYKFENRGSDWGEDEEFKSQWMFALDEFFSTILHGIVKDSTQLEPLSTFVSQFDKYLCQTLDSETTSTLFTVMPRTKLLPLAIHPLMIAIYHNIITQVHF